MDRRQARSRQAIMQAFDQLLVNEPFNDITVQEIIDQANIGRSTFYAHFETKNALLEEMCTELFAHVTARSSKAELTHDFSVEQPNTDSIMMHVLYHVQDDTHHIIELLNGESSELFIHYFKAKLQTVLDEPLRKNLKHINIPESFALHFLVCAFVDTLYWWIQSDMIQTPEEVEQYYYTVIGAVL